MGETIIDKAIATGKANLEVFSETLQSLAEKDRDIIVVTSDSRGSGKLLPFGKRFPGQIVEVGIAEQNLVGMAAGLASAGKKVFAVSPACFLTARALEQIKNDVAYSDNPIIAFTIMLCCGLLTILLLLPLQIIMKQSRLF
jgi:transketolase